MRKLSFRRSLTLVLALMLVLSVLPAAALAADPFIQLVATDVSLDETNFEYTGEAIRPNVTVRSNGQLLTLDEHYHLDFANNVEVGEAKVIVTGIATAGYAGTVEHPFFINEKRDEEQAPEFTLITLTDEMVTLEETEFPYTGQPIEPAVTVTVEGKTLEAGRDYALEYVNNLVPGTGTVIVRGIATASEELGYTGEVRKDFTIRPVTGEEYPLTEIKGTDVTIEGTTFPYTGKAIEPKITVKVEGKELVRDKDYMLRYVNNTEPGTASAIVTGLATAAESGGYTGEVKIDFTITKAEDAKSAYKLTKGDKGVWYLGSSGALSFTADGPFDALTGVSVNGKKLEKTDYDAKEGTVILLKNAFLKELEAGNHTITIHFADADVEGTFRIAEAGENPKTGDTIAMWLLLMLATGTAAALLLRKKTAF